MVNITKNNDFFLLSISDPNLIEIYGQEIRDVSIKSKEPEYHYLGDYFTLNEDIKINNDDLKNIKKELVNSPNHDGNKLKKSYLERKIKDGKRKKIVLEEKLKNDFYYVFKSNKENAINSAIIEADTVVKMKKEYNYLRLSIIDSNPINSNNETWENTIRPIDPEYVYLSEYFDLHQKNDNSERKKFLEDKLEKDFHYIFKMNN